MLGEALEQRVHFSTTFLVTTTADSGTGSLRQAITSADQTSGQSIINFSIGSGAATITPLSQLPVLTASITINGTTQPGYAGKPLITINGSSAGSGTSGIDVTGSGCSILGLAIDNFGSNGLYLDGTGGTVVQGNYIGVNAAGTAAAANGGDGILALSPNNLIGGTTASARNLISGNGAQGLCLYASAATGNNVEGNFIGTNASGTASISNYLCGVCVYGGNNNTIGGSLAGDGNLLSGNGNDGVVILGGASGTVVAGNLMGTDVTGTLSVPNGFYGIEVDSGGNTVGGLTAGARNIISGNDQAGVVLYQPYSVGNVVEGNYVGTDITGSFSVGVQPDGVDVDDGATYNTVGGTSHAASNLISGNLDHGLGFFGTGTLGNVAEGNYIGTNPSGTSAVGNGLVDEGGLGGGVLSSDGAGGNTVGGAVSGAGNVISGNGTGVILFGASGSLQGTAVEGNLIGFNASDTSTLGNVGDGVFIVGANNIIGGPTSAYANTIYAPAANDVVNISSGNDNVIENNITTPSTSFGPAVIVTAPAVSSSTSSNTPTFSGIAQNVSGDLSQIQIYVYSGNSASGTPVEKLSTTWNAYTGLWSITAAPALAIGTYTVTATESTSGGATATSTPDTFIIDPGSSTTPLPGTASASSTSTFNNDGNTFANVFDGNTNTFWDGPTANGDWVQWNLGSPQSISFIGYAPRVGYEVRMVGGVFEASNDPTFATGVTVLYTASAQPPDGLSYQPVGGSATYQYVRYVAPAGSYGNIAEMQVFGSGGVAPAAPGKPSLVSSATSTATIAWTASTTAGVSGYNILRNGSLVGTTNGTTLTYTDTGLTASTTYSYTVEAVSAVGIASAPTAALLVTTSAAPTPVQLTGTPSANTTGSYGNDGNNYLKAFDGNTSTYFDAPNASGNWIQLNFGSPKTITSIAFAPRVGFEARMVGGVVEASNDPNFVSGVVTLYTLTSQPADGLTSIAVSPAGAYQYIRYVSPAGSYGDIAEMQAFGTVGTVVTTNPASLTIDAGTSVTFTAAATGTNSVQWMVETPGSASFSPISGATSATLNLGAATLAQSGNLYEAVFTDYSGYNATTSAATLTVDPVWLNPSSAAAWNASTHILTVTGATSITADPGTDEPIVQATGSAAVLTLNPASGTDIHLGGLSLSGGASANETSLGVARSLTNYHLLVIGTPGSSSAPTFSIDSTSTLDLADNDLAILYGTGTSPLPQVQEYLQSACDGGKWDKPGLTSSIAPSTAGATGLGYATSTELGISSFDGLSLGGNALLVKYTLMGDTTLSGTVSGADYNTVLSNYDSVGDWSEGNFHYGGTYYNGVFTNDDVAGQDYNTVLSSFDNLLSTYLIESAATPAITATSATNTTSATVTENVFPTSPTGSTATTSAGQILPSPSVLSTSSVGRTTDDTSNISRTVETNRNKISPVSLHTTKRRPPGRRARSGVKTASHDSATSTGKSL